MKKRVILVSSLTMLLRVSLPLATFGQDASDAEGSPVLEEVTVTGTLIRGIAPIGTNVVDMDREAIEATGVTSANELLAQVPQVTNFFNTLPVPTTELGLPINRPNIRSLGASGGNTTLVLLNGWRLPGAGINQTTPDASVIPPAILQQLEVIPDGGSSLYGSDAIGGVINFITRDEFTGVEFAGKYGRGDDYDNKEYTLTAGTQWEGGGGLISLYWTENDSLTGDDRSWISGNHTAKGGQDFRISNCTPGNIIVGGESYRMDTRQPGQNLCEPTDLISMVPEQERGTVFASLNHQLNERMRFELSAIYSDRDVDFEGKNGGASTGVEGGGRISSANPFFDPLGGENAHNVEFSYEEVFGGGYPSTGAYESYNVMAMLQFSLTNGWLASLGVNYGASENESRTGGIDRDYEAEALVATTVDAAINPYAVLQTNPAVIDRLTDYVSGWGRSDQDVLQLRGVADGPLIELPAGEAKLAIGVEYLEQETEPEWATDTSFSSPTFYTNKFDRDVKSLYGELFLPALAASSPIGALDFSLAARYDDYSDVGDTTNPKIGFNWSPTPSFLVRGNWGTSFQAPNLADSGQSVDSRAQYIPVSPWLAPDAGQIDVVRPTILLAGGGDELESEEADTWSLGFDWDINLGDGLRISATYYDIDYENAISVVPFFQPWFFTNPSLEQFYVTNPTQQQAEAILDGYRYDGFESIEDLYAGPFTPYLITDARRTNLASIETSGVDFQLTQALLISEVLVTASLAGNYVLEREATPVPGGESVDELDEGNAIEWSLNGNLGFNWKQWQGALTVVYKDGYDNGTTDLDSFTVANLYLNYELPVTGLFDRASVSLNVDNITDEEPPYLADFDGIDMSHSFSIGRVYSLGFKVSI